MARREPLWRREGFRSEYAYRAAGKTGEEKQRAVGKRGPAAFDKALKQAESITVVQTGRGKAGRFRTVTVSVRDNTGRVRTYTFRGKAITTPELRKLARKIDKSGATFTPVYRDPKSKGEQRAAKMIPAEADE